MMVYNDIEDNGKLEKCFNEGAMCLLYKKND